MTDVEQVSNLNSQAGCTTIPMPMGIAEARRARLEAGLTQVEVAARLGKHQSFVAKSEPGERRVDVVELTDLARIYDKSLQYFVK